MTAGQRKTELNSVRLVLSGGLLMMIVVGILAWWLWPMRASFGIEASVAGTVAHLRSWGPWAALGSIALMVVHAFLPFPSEFITLANGMVFGPWWGTLVTWIGAMLGAVATFALVRLLGRPFVYRMLSGAQRRRLSDWSTRRGGAALLIGRLIPVIAFNLLNYSAALTDISWWTFLWATGLGILPLTVLLNVFGDSLLNASAWNWAWLSAGILALLGWMLLKRWAHKAKPR